MENENKICAGYEAELAALAALDRRYYLNRSPTLADRAAYAARQAQLDKARSRFYSELTEFRHLRRCRSVIANHVFKRRPS